MTTVLKRYPNPHGGEFGRVVESDEGVVMYFTQRSGRLHLYRKKDSWGIEETVYRDFCTAFPHLQYIVVLDTDDHTYYKVERKEFGVRCELLKAEQFNRAWQEEIKRYGGTVTPEERERRNCYGDQFHLRRRWWERLSALVYEAKRAERDEYDLPRSQTKLSAYMEGFR